MNPIRSLALAVTLALLAVMPTAHADDLVQIYKEARASDPQLAGAEATKLATDENIDQARALLLPQIDASLGLQRSHGSGGGSQFTYGPDGTPTLITVVSGSDIRSRSVSGNLNQSILDLSRWSALKETRDRANAGDATLDSAQQALYIRVSTAYFNVLTAQDSLLFAQGNEAALSRQLEQAQQRFEVGLSAITDVNDAKAQHDTAVANVITAQNTLDDNREALRQLTGNEPGDLKKLRDDLPLNTPSPADAEAWVDVAVKENPLLRSATFNLDAANQTIKTQRAGHLPTINGQVIYSKNDNWGDRYSAAAGPNFPSNSDQWSTTVGVSLNVPIFSGGATQSRVRQAIYNRDFTEQQLEQNKRDVVRTTRNSYRAVIAGASQVEATRQAVVSAQSSVDATQAGYEVGTRTIVDVLISQQQLLQAQSSYSQARHNFVINGLLLKQSAGIIGFSDIEAVNALLN